MKRLDKKMNRVCVLAIGTMAVLGSLASARAATSHSLSWNNTNGGNWADPGNWSEGGSPNTASPINTTTDTYAMQLDGLSTSYTVTYGSDLYGTVNSFTSLTLRNSSGSSPNTITLNIAAPNFRAASGMTVGKNGTLSILANSSISSFGNVTTNSGGLMNVGGTLTVGSGAAINQQGGTISILAGGRISITNATSQILVGNSVGSSAMNVDGVLDNKGTEANGRGIFVATYGTAANTLSSNVNASNNVLNVTTNADVTNSGRFALGQILAPNLTNLSGRTLLGSGTMNMSGGSWVNAGNVLVGYNNNSLAEPLPLSNATGNFNLSGGTFKVTGATAKVYVGASSATGTMTISGGSLGTSDSLINEVVVGGTYDNSDVTSGSGAGMGTSAAIAGKGTFVLSGGAVYTKQFTAKNGADKSIVTISGGSLNSGGTTIGNGAALVVGDGTHMAAFNMIAGGSGTHSFANGIVVAANSTLSGSGHIVGDVTINGTLDAGALNLANNLAFSTGSVLKVTLGSSSIVFDSGTVTGAQNADLVLALGDSFDYSASYTLLRNVANDDVSFGSITGYDSARYTAKVTQDGDNYLVSFVPVPEPACGMLIAAGSSLIFRRRRLL